MYLPHDRTFGSTPLSIPCRHPRSPSCGGTASSVKVILAELWHWPERWAGMPYKVDPPRVRSDCVRTYVLSGGGRARGLVRSLSALARLDFYDGTALREMSGANGEKVRSKLTS